MIKIRKISDGSCSNCMYKEDIHEITLGCTETRGGVVIRLCEKCMNEMYNESNKIREENTINKSIIFQEPQQHVCNCEICKKYEVGSPEWMKATLEKANSDIK